MLRSLHDFLRSGRVRMMDGAMGTELQRLGLRPPQRGEDWNLDRPDAVLAVHRAYASAGADVLLTNTFQANPFTQPHRLADILRSGVELARRAAGPERFVLLNLGPITDPANPDDLTCFRHLIDIVRRLELDIDGIMLETWSGEGALRAADLAAGAGRPVLLSLWYRRTDAGRYVSADGHAPEWFAKQARVAALGVNCGPEIDVLDCAEIVRRYRLATDLPLFARPNAGTPRRDDDAWVYPRSPDAMATDIRALLDAGAWMIGGCCGTTPEHIAAFGRVSIAPGEKMLEHPSNPEMDESSRAP